MSWNLVELGAICDITNGSTPLRSNPNYWENGNINWFTIEDIRRFGREINQTTQFVTEKALKETSLKIVPTNTVLLCCTASVGEFAITKIPLAMNQQFNGLTLKTDKVLPEFLFHYCSTLKEKLISVSGSTTINFVAISKLKKITIPLPTLSIQKKIVSKLDAIFAEIDKATAAAEANAKNAEALFQSYLTEVFVRGGEDWSTKSVEDLVTEKIITKPFDGNHGEIHPVAADYTQSGIPFLMASDLKDGLVDVVNCKFLPKAITDKLRVGFAKNNDILITHKGTIGRVAKLRTDLDYVMLTPQVTSYRVLRDDFLSRDFLFSYFQSSIFQTQLYEMAKGGSTRAYAGITKQSSLLIKIPPLDEQNKLSNFFHQLETEKSKLVCTYISKVKNLMLLKQSILQRAFSGELVKA